MWENGEFRRVGTYDGREREDYWLDYIVSWSMNCEFMPARYCPDEAEDIVHQAFVNGYDKIVEERNESEQRSYLYSTAEKFVSEFYS